MILLNSLAFVGRNEICFSFYVLGAIRNSSTTPQVHKEAYFNSLYSFS